MMETSAYDDKRGGVALEAAASMSLLNTQQSPPPPSTPAGVGLATQYQSRSVTPDEMLDRDGAIRPHWRTFVASMDALGQSQIMARWEQARRLIRENGITHNVYGEADGFGRPWNLDLLPLLIPAAEWDTMGRALIQRARLLNALAADLYGPQTCLTNGWLPAELLYANPGFLRPAFGIQPPGNQWMHLYGADLVRSADGEFRVMGDRTQAPSGSGYSLENRIVLTRVLPSVFRQCHVLRLAPFFISLRKTLVSLAPANRENPRVVLLTPGPYNETYFEHAYLARYLGYTLVQGNDLTVRDGRVFLKTLSGLQRVDVILRRLDDDFCDPLELYSESFLGVPGLLQAVREGNVAVANSIGSGVLQAPALLPFLPSLCRKLLGQELAMASVPTWWCGQRDAMRYVLANLKDLVVKPAFAIAGSQSTFGRSLSAVDLEKLAARIEARPENFVGQEHADSYSVPVLDGNRVQPRRFVVRAYLAASEGSYVVMPGGLTRASGSAESLVVSLQQGGGSKDTWIVSDGPVPEVTLLTAASLPVELSRGGGDLPSRVADDLFWLGRYVQRSEAIVRLARCVFNRLTDPNALPAPGPMSLLVRQLVGRGSRAETETSRELAAELFAAGDPAGLREAVRHVHGLARVLRDRISADAWQILREIESELAQFSTSVTDDQIAQAMEMLNRLVAGFLAFSGMVADSMTRGQAFRFLDLGMRLERALALAGLVRATLVQTADEERFTLDALLEIADSSLTYRRRYLTQVEAPAVVDLLFADETNPRSVAFGVAAIHEHLTSLPRDAGHPQRSQDVQLAIKLRASMRLADLTAACRATGGRRERLDRLAGDIIESLAVISSLLGHTYFSHASGDGRLLVRAEGSLS